MADIAAENSSASGRIPGLAAEQPPRRMHTYSRLTTAIAVLGLAASLYALWRLEATRDRLDQVNDAARTLAADRDLLRAELRNLGNRERQARRELDQRLDALDAVPRQLQELGGTVEELRGRAQGPERAWSRAEALFLLELAQHRLTLDRDVGTAIVALESADTRLASLRDPSFAAVRQQIARDLLALRAVRLPDVTGILARLAGAEEQAIRAQVKGMLAAQPPATGTASLPDGMFARAWAVSRRALAQLIVVRKVDGRAGTVVTSEEQLLRRQHLQLQLFAARTAVIRHDLASYRSSLAAARMWLGEFFDLSDPAAASLLDEVQALEPIDIDPALPDIAASIRALQHRMPARQGPE